MASAEPPPILRFPVADKGDEFFLLEATPYGSKPLDLKLRGSEGSAVFAAKRELPLPPSPFPFTPFPKLRGHLLDRPRRHAKKLNR